MFIVLQQFCTILSFDFVDGLRDSDVIVDNAADMFYNEYDEILSDERQQDEEIISELSDDGFNDLDAVNRYRNRDGIRDDEQFNRNHISGKEHKEHGDVREKRKEERHSHRKNNIHDNDREQEKAIHRPSWDNDSDHFNGKEQSEHRDVNYEGKRSHNHYHHSWDNHAHGHDNDQHMIKSSSNDEQYHYVSEEAYHRNKHMKILSSNNRRTRLHSRLNDVVEKRKRDGNYYNPLYCWYQLKHETRRTCYGEMCVDVTITKFIQECISL